MRLGEKLRKEDTFALIPRLEEIMTKFQQRKNPNSQEACPSFFSMIDNTGSPERKEFRGKYLFMDSKTSNVTKSLVWLLFHLEGHVLSGSAQRKLHGEPGFAEKQQVMTFGRRT